MNSETDLLTLQYLYDSNFCALEERKSIMTDKMKIEIIWSGFTWTRGAKVAKFKNPYIRESILG